LLFGYNKLSTEVEKTCCHPNPILSGSVTLGRYFYTKSREFIFDKSKSVFTGFSKKSSAFKLLRQGAGYGFDSSITGIWKMAFIVVQRLPTSVPGRLWLSNTRVVA
jgi:hypothetical protein